MALSVKLLMSGSLVVNSDSGNELWTSQSSRLNQRKISVPGRSVLQAIGRRNVVECPSTFETLATALTDVDNDGRNMYLDKVYEILPLSLAAILICLSFFSSAFS